MKITKLLALTLLTPIASFATGLSFQTLSPVAGEVRTSSGANFASGTTINFGTMTSTTGFTTFDQYNGAFTSLTTATVTAAGDFSASIAAGNVAAGTGLWLVISAGTEQGVFSLGTAPSLGSLSSFPANATAVIGSNVGSNIQTVSTVVPEPSTYAMFAGVLALGYVMIRRRK